MEAVLSSYVFIGSYVLKIMVSENNCSVNNYYGSSCGQVMIPVIRSSEPAY